MGTWQILIWWPLCCSANSMVEAKVKGKRQKSRVCDRFAWNHQGLPQSCDRMPCWVEGTVWHLLVLLSWSSQWCCEWKKWRFCSSGSSRCVYLECLTAQWSGKSKRSWSLLKTILLWEDYCNIFLLSSPGFVAQEQTVSCVSFFQH